MNKTRLQRENSIKYLGVIFDEKLCWANYIDNYLINLLDALSVLQIAQLCFEKNSLPALL